MIVSKFKLKDIIETIEEEKIPIEGSIIGGKDLILIWKQEPNIKEFNKLEKICNKFNYKISPLTLDDLEFIKSIVQERGAKINRFKEVTKTGNKLNIKKIEVK